MSTRLELRADDVERVRQVLEAELSPYPRPWENHNNPQIRANPVNNETLTVIEDGKEYKIAERFQFRGQSQEDEGPEKAKQACMKLLPLLDKPDYMRFLDDALAPRLECTFKPRDSQEEAVRGACRILSRLPSHPPSMTDHIGTNTYENILEYDLVDGTKKSAWENLQVSTSLDRNTIRLALHFATNQPTPKSRPDLDTVDLEGLNKPMIPWPEIVLDHINNLCQLLEASHEVSAQEQDPEKARGWFLVKAYIWTRWHRALLMHLSAILDMKLRFGAALNPETDYLQFNGTRLIASLSASKPVPQLVCLWSWELLRSDRTLFGQDLRCLHERYEAFARLCATKSRCCINDHKTAIQCNGSSPFACDRFTRMKVEDQSAHAATCSKNCSRLYWHERSFRNVVGARAVSISHDGSDGYLRYCMASRKTMAISHVWSHGQGGRPEKHGTGFNSCLHRRYSTIARANGCDSYWIDTACIPEDPQLRYEAITKINEVFRDSRLTLICDRDIMSINVRHLSIELKEILLTVFLVCDWNVRSWTFLEAMRGRARLHLLCNDDRLLSVKSLVEDVNLEGSLEIAIPFVTSKHLLPAVPSGQFKPREELNDVQWKVQQGYFDIEEAATLLSRRYASRSGDELIIWSLLCGEAVYKTAAAFWMALQDNKSPGGLTDAFSMDMAKRRWIRTGFLVSSAPRILNTRGLGWAPRRPDLSYDLTSSGYKAYFTYDGCDSQFGSYDEKGLTAEWLFTVFPGPGWSAGTRVRLMFPFFFDVSEQSPLQKLISQELRGFRWGALIRPVHMSSTSRKVDKMPALHRGGSTGQTVVLIGSQDLLEWEWIGVHELDDKTIASLEFEKKDIKLV